MRIDILVAEIGSTTTIVNAFNGINSGAAEHIGAGAAATSVLAGDVRVGLNAAIADLRQNLGAAELEYDKFLATSSAAGGLRMTVHGLVADMTARAGREAALGAGGNIHLATAGLLTPADMEDISKIAPNLILLAGGTDFGDRDCALHNARLLCRAGAPVIYCGNIQNQKEITDIFHKAGAVLYICENVYPRLDGLNIEPVRRLVHRAFEAHITRAPGMGHIREMVDGAIMPTPGAVMECAMLLYGLIGDLVVVDVGGATTDIHSVTHGCDEIGLLATEPEPFAKRTVEGDLGLFVNAQNLAQMVGFDKLAAEIGADIPAIFADYPPIPKTANQINLASRLAYYAAAMAIGRHAGRLAHIYGVLGRRTIASGKDLTAVQNIIATGGALTRLPDRAKIMADLRDLNRGGEMLYPKLGKMNIREDGRYIMAAIGVLSRQFPDAAVELAKRYFTTANCANECE